LSDWIGTSTRVTALADSIGTSTRPQLYTQRRLKNKAKPQLHTLKQVSKTTEVKTAAEMERRGGHHRTERATAVQDPTPQCCCTRKGHWATCRNTESEPPTCHSARLTLSCAGSAQTRHTAPHSRLVSKILVEVAQRGAPPSEPNQVADHHRGSNHLAASPSCKPPPSS
jgi:hypothetical protein